MKVHLTPVLYLNGLLLYTESIIHCDFCRVQYTTVHNSQSMPSEKNKMSDGDWSLYNNKRKKLKTKCFSWNLCMQDRSIKVSQQLMRECYSSDYSQLSFAGRLWLPCGLIGGFTRCGREDRFGNTSPSHSHWVAPSTMTSIYTHLNTSHQWCFSHLEAHCKVKRKEWSNLIGF